MSALIVQSAFAFIFPRDILMKKFLIHSAALAAVLATSPAMADAKPDASGPSDEGGRAPTPAAKSRSYGVFVNPFAIANGSYGAEFDLKLNTVTTLNLGGAFYSASASGGKWTGFSGSAGTQFFPFASAFEGFYAFPRVEFASLSYTPSNSATSDVSSSVFGAGATLGYQWAWDMGLAVRVGAGALYYSASASGGSASLALSGVLPAIDLTLGYVF